MKLKLKCLLLTGLLSSSLSMAQQQSDVLSVSASANAKEASLAFDKDIKTMWTLSPQILKSEQWMMCTIQQPGDVAEIILQLQGVSKEELKAALDIFVTYDPMNLGNPVNYTVEGTNKEMKLKLTPKYGAHVKLALKAGKLTKPFSLKEATIILAKKDLKDRKGEMTSHRYMDPTLPVEERVEDLLAAMTPEDKMELIREGWGIPGIPHLYVPPISKVEAVHGFSYGSGATIFPQALSMGATFNKQLTEEIAMAIGDETVAAHTKQAWSPVLDVAQDARWGRCEETFGEDPVLVSQIGGAWIKGYQSKGLFTTPKHFGGHGAPLGGRDSHDIGLSEREMREVHLVPFRHVIRNYDCQSLMMAYSDYMGVPVAKSKELLQQILRQEWGFNGFIVSDCGAIGNLTARKHYTAKDKIEAANQSLAAGIATNCGDTYNDKEVIAAAKDGRIDMKNLDEVCRTMLRVMFRNELFENNPCKPLDWNKIYPGWNSDTHKEMAREAARQSIVMLENKDNILPISKNLRTIAVLGPGADDLQPGDYTPKLQPGQLKSVLTGIKNAVGKQTKVLYEQGCDFTTPNGANIPKAVKAASQADVVVIVLGDCSTSESTGDVEKTCGENHDLATLILPGKQQELLEAVCAAGKPVILILQSGRPYNLSKASELCKGILVNWLPGQEGGPATADVLFGDYNPAGRLPMTFPRHVGQLPLYYNFKTSGRRYEYADMEYYPLYRFGFGLSYTSFEYSDLRVQEQANGNITVQATVKNVGQRAGDEVAQLYVTDMYASVKTRITELKDFTRIHLEPGQSQTVKFELTPYQISLLNDQMDRVVEKGEFKILVGGVSPEYRANDRIKDSVGYKDKKLGVSGMLDYSHEFAADFALSVSKVEENLVTDKKTVWISVKNNGTIMDTGKIGMYVGGQKEGDNVHYELAPGEEKLIPFEVDKDSASPVTFITKYRTITL
ncbi:glycoside hydrolase family 3 C-terminal domain-containing protein [uncultured Bacteroides sp.]|uniref:glycoside hydrolase family 3 C-terminal domain-containing protein n=1 Tax=uncultured Bacteroides sp. TaxID=162156 RepID=UPI002600CEED|nr:glycoside hydrolase family 3 C-terminal domain-containing protein [uncultured Bacteroides sp.]